MKTRAGATMIELVTALALLGLLSAACVALLRSQTALLRQVSERAATGEALRAASGILHAEFRDVVAEDISGSSSDSLALRVFRGIAVVCAVDGDAAVLRYHGLREPDPTKDSLLIVEAERPMPFRVVTGRPLCVARSGEQLITIEPADPLEHGSLLLIFESGAYYMANGALRYRRGVEGRQPLTDELLDHRQGGFTMEPRGVRIRLRAKAGSNGDTYVRFTNPR